MRVLVIGSGGREHALAWKLAQSPSVEKLYCSPGNPGTAAVAENVGLPAGGWGAVADWAERLGIDLTVVGPEDPLIEGAVDAFEARGLVAFGPRQSAALLEGSKSWAKEVMAAAGVPTAASATFDSYDDARSYLLAQPTPIVVKADGLARGKGVTVARTREEALAALDDCMRRRVFGDSGSRVVVEECLTGREVSVFSISDGERFVTLPPACDYKPIFDGDRGPNTGGVGFGDKHLQESGKVPRIGHTPSDGIKLCREALLVFGKLGYHACDALLVGGECLKLSQTGKFESQRLCPRKKPIVDCQGTTQQSNNKCRDRNKLSITKVNQCVEMARAGTLVHTNTPLLRKIRSGPCLKTLGDLEKKS